MFSPFRKILTYFNNLSIRLKFIISVLYFIVLLSTTLLIISSLQEHRITNLFLSTLSEKVETFDNLFEMNTRHLGILIFNQYGQRERMSEFIKRPNREFAENNIDCLISDYSLNSVWVYNSDLVQVYTKSDGLIQNNRINLENFKKKVSSNRELRFYEKVDSEFVEFYGTSVIDSDKNNNRSKTFGYLIAARIINKNYLTELEKLFDCSIQITANEDTTFRCTGDPAEVSFVKPIFSLNEKPSAYLNIKLQSEIINESILSARKLFLIYAHISFFVLLTFIIFFFRIVSSPLNKITRSLDVQNSAPLEVLMEKKDEFGKIANLISIFFNQKSQLEHQINQRQKAEDDLQKLNKLLEKKVTLKNAELKALIEQAPFAIAIFDKYGKLLESNKFYQSLFSINEKGEKNFALLKEILYSNNRDDYDKLEILAKKGGEFYTLPIDMRLERNEIFNIDRHWLIFRFFSIKPTDSDDIRIAGIIEDVSENRKVEEAEKKLTESEQLSLAIYTAQEEERKRVSSELHDSIGQKLSMVQMKLELYCKANEGQASQLMEIKETVFATGNELRNIIRNLHPADLDDYGLIKSLDLLCQEISNMTNIKIYFNTYEFPEDLDPVYQLNIYRIVQEALNNVAKHSGASEASVQIYYRDNYILINIEDSGKGIDLEVQDIAVLKSSYGLLNMKRRTETLKGNFYIDSSESLGTEIHIKIPWG